MAIFVFGVLILIGTLPNGLASMQTARRQAAETRIFQHLRAVYQAELDRAPASELNSTLTNLEQPASFLFDDSGEPLRSASGAQPAFASQAQLEPAGKLPGEADPSPFARRLRIAVTDRWQENAALTDPARHRQRVLMVTLTSPLLPRQAPPSSNDPSDSSPP